METVWHTQSEVADRQQQEYQISHSSGDSLSSATAVEVAFNRLLINMETDTSKNAATENQTF